MGVEVGVVGVVGDGSVGSGGSVGDGSVRSGGVGVGSGVPTTLPTTHSSSLPDLVLSDGIVIRYNTSVVALSGRNPKELHPGEIYIGRNQFQGGWKMSKSIWENPYPVKQHGLVESLRLFREYIRGRPDLMARLPELKGQTLACWCHKNKGGNHCHGDVLMGLME